MKNLLISSLIALAATVAIPSAAVAGPVPKDLLPCQVLFLTPAGSIAGPAVCTQ